MRCLSHRACCNPLSATPSWSSIPRCHAKELRVRQIDIRITPAVHYFCLKPSTLSRTASTELRLHQQEGPISVVGKSGRLSRSVERTYSAGLLVYSSCRSFFSCLLCDAVSSSMAGGQPVTCIYSHVLRDADCHVGLHRRSCMFDG